MSGMRSAVMGLVLWLMAVTSAEAGADDEIRAALERFVAAQNAHDVRLVADLLWDSPQFLWITRGTAIWGRPAALTRFDSLYQGTWRLEPELADLRITHLAESVAEIHVPIVFSIGPAGQEPQKTRFLMNQVLVRTGNGWKVATILPIPAAAP
ncbi:MAG: YybH family protein [Candidatus Rokuibacteriota bacterium]